MPSWTLEREDLSSRECVLSVHTNISLVFSLRPMSGCILQHPVRCQRSPPTIDPSPMISPESEPSISNFNCSGMDVVPFHRFLQSTIKLPPFPVVRPFNWQRLVTTILFIVASGTIGKLAWPKVSIFLTNKNTWAAISLVHASLSLLIKDYNSDVYLWTHV